MISNKALLQITMLSMASSLFMATMTPLLVSSMLCPLLPTRWRSLVTCRGLLYWITRSILPMSMPSSKLLVQITVRKSPVLSPFSVAILLVLASEPWCMLSGNSVSHMLNLLVSASLVLLVFVNMRVVSWFSIKSFMTLSRTATSG